MRRTEDRDRIGRLRGWIVYLLYKARPNPLELTVLQQALDANNFPCSRLKLAQEVDYLKSIGRSPSGTEGLVKVFPQGSSVDLTGDPVAQAKLLQRYAAFESDAEMGVVVCARLSSLGIDFQDGLLNFESIHRVE